MISHSKLLLLLVATLAAFVLSSALIAAPAEPAENAAAGGEAAAATDEQPADDVAKDHPECGNYAPAKVTIVDEDGNLTETTIELPEVLGEAPDMREAAAELAPDGNGEEAEAEEPEIDPAEVIRRIIENMGESADRLTARKEVGQGTQVVQKEVVSDLEKLIEHMAEQ